MTVEKPKSKQLLRPITIGTNSAMNQSQFLAITCNSLEAREKSRVQAAIGFGFASHWLKNWRDSFKPITKRSNRNHVITFDGHLKTTLKLAIATYKLAIATCNLRVSFVIDYMNDAMATWMALRDTDASQVINSDRKAQVSNLQRENRRVPYELPQKFVV